MYRPASWLKNCYVREVSLVSHFFYSFLVFAFTCCWQISPLRAAGKSSNTLLNSSLDASHQHIGLHFLVNHLTPFCHLSVTQLFVLPACCPCLAWLPFGSNTFTIHIFHLWLVNFRWKLFHIFVMIFYNGEGMFIEITNYLCHGWSHYLWEHKFSLLMLHACAAWIKIKDLPASDSLSPSYLAQR